MQLNAKQIIHTRAPANGFHQGQGAFLERALGLRQVRDFLALLEHQDTRINASVHGVHTYLDSHRTQAH